MKGAIKGVVVFLGIIFAVFSSQTSASTLGTSPFIQAGSEAGVVRALSAANVAFVDGLPKSNVSDSEIDRFASNPENYRIVINYESDGYVIDYEIKPFKGSGFRGGGYRYFVDRVSYQVVKTVVHP